MPARRPNVFSSLFRSRPATSGYHPARWGNRHRLFCEQLEDRVTPAGLRVLNASPLRLDGGPLDHIDVQFSATVDALTFTADDVTLTGPGGAVTVAGISELAPDLYRLSLASQTDRGTYQLRVGPNIVDGAGDRMDQNGNGVPGEPSDAYAGTALVTRADVTFKTPATIGATNTTYDGQSILIDGTTVTIDGAHHFKAIHLINGAVLTHSANTSTQTHKLDLTVDEQVIVDATSRIDVSGRGYLPGRTTGNATAGAATGEGGGSYGGLGTPPGPARGAGGGPGAVYGDYADPDDWGAGAGPSGARGGGLVRIRAGTLQLDGQVVADGAAGQGSGAGGGVYVSAGVLRGSGLIRARGGASSNDGGGGGGGRVAVYAADMAGFDPARVTAPGGAGRNGAAGTVYLRDTDDPVGTLVIDNGAGSSSVWTPLGLPGQAEFSIPDRVVVSGRTTAAAAGPDTRLDFQNGLELRDGGRLVAGVVTADAISVLTGGILTAFDPSAARVVALDLRVAGTLYVDAASTIDVTRKGYLSGRTAGNVPVSEPLGNSGGSHGGRGGSLNGTSPPAHGDPYDPDEFGGGGPILAGNPINPAATAGGGLVRVRAATLRLDGSVVANGVDQWPRNGGGAGGGVYIDADTFAGSGAITAAGGWGWGGGPGGGGRVAIYYRTLAGFDLSKVRAPAGANPSAGLPGRDGTVHVVNGFSRTHARAPVPAGINGGHLGHAIGGSVTLRFNRAIDIASFDPGLLAITGQMGVVRALSMTEVGDRTYRFDLDRALTEEGTYHFALSATLRDFEGYQLDQNANGITGEAGDGYSWTYVVDTVAPRVVAHAPAGDVAGTVGSVDVIFSEKLDKPTFTTGDVVITRPDGQIIAVTGLTEVGFDRYRISFAPQTLVGTYHVRVGPDVRDPAGNRLDQDRDGVFGEAGQDVYDATFNLVPVDLGLNSLRVGAAALVAGETVTITWQGQNRTGAQLLGDWNDAVYLSTDGQWSINDIRLALVPHTGGLAAGATYTGSATVVIPGVLPGDYRVIVRADVANQERETNEANNLVASPELALSVRPLTAGVPVSAALTAADRVDYFAVTLGSGESLKLKLHAATPGAVAQLSVSYAAIPTRMSFDERSATPTADQEVSLTAINGGGTYYVFVYGDRVSGTAAYTLTAETEPFFVTGVTPTRHGNAVPAVVTLTGTGFGPDTVVDLVSAAGAATRVGSEFVSDATLRLTGLPAAPGVYHVRVTQNGRVAELRSAFEVTEGGTAALATNLVVPGSVSPGFPVKQTLWVEYRNTGTVAMPAPLLQVTGDGNARLTASEAVANAMMTARTGQVGLGNSVQVLGVGSSATPGLLQPGESGRIPVYYVGLSQDVGAARVTFSLGSLSALDTTEKVAYLPGPDERIPFERPGHGRRDVEEVGVEPYRVVRADPQSGGASGPTTGQVGGTGGSSIDFQNYPNVYEEYLRIDWREMLAARPESIPADAWGAIVYNLRHDIIDGRGGIIFNPGAGGVGGGFTSSTDLWADYVAELAGTADYLAGIGQTTSDVGALWGLKVADASAALNPVRYLAGAVDASAPAPGLPLTFSRVYGQDIVSRFRTGVLGRGWTHNWDVHATANGTGDVVLHGPGGVERFFARNKNGTYAASAGDYGRLALVGGAYTLTETDGTVWRFRADGKLDHVRDTNGNQITLAYGSTGYLLSLTHSSGRQFRLEYDDPEDGDRRLARLIDAAGPGTADDRVTTFGYDDAREHLVRVTAPGDRVTEYAYRDAVSTSFGVVVPAPIDGLPERVISSENASRMQVVALAGMKPDSHALTSVTHPDGTHDFFDYDDRGRLTGTSADGGAEAVTFSYADLQDNAPGRVLVTDATGTKTVLSFGLGGQLVQVRDGTGRIVHFGYDNRFQFSTLTGPGGERYRYGYDAAGNLTGVRDALNLETSFSYEPSHQRLASFTDARGNGIDYQYDARGNLTAIVYEDGTREKFTHDGVGNVLTATNRRGQVTVYTYNTAGQVLTKDYSNTPGVADFAYTYDTHGNLTSATETIGTATTADDLRTVMTYDVLTDRLMRIDYPGGHWFTFTYDDAGRRESRTDETGRVVRYGYDAAGRLDTMTADGEGLLVDYDYDPAGRLSKKTLGNGVYTTYEYDSAGNVEALTNLRADGAVLSRYSYTYDVSGRRTSMTTLDGTFTYGYDATGQLVRVTHPDGRVVVYDYDAAGNRRAVTDDGVETEYTANNLNQYTRVGNDTYEFDLDGNLFRATEGGVVTTYTYNTENRLVGVQRGADTWAYRYDALGNRVGATENGVATSYVIDPTGLGNVAAEFNGSSLVARYDHGYGLLSRSDAAGSAAFYTFQAIGHTSEVTGTGGQVLNSYQYDPFGVSLGKTEAVANPFEYVGEYGVMHEGNGLEFMRARYFDAATGRFIHVDPFHIAGGLNLYAYARNEVVSSADPSGWAPNPNDPGMVPGPHPRTPSPGVQLPPQPWRDDQLYFRPHPNPHGSITKDYDYLLREHLEKIDRHVGKELQPGLPLLQLVLEVPNRVFELYKYLEWKIENYETDYYVDLARSRDPNDKLAPAGVGDAAFVLPDSSLAYTVRFENMPEATAPAHEILVTDVLDPNLDLDTFELTEIAFANVRLAVPAGRDHYETTLPFVANGVALRIEVTATLDRATRTFTLSLYTTDPATGWTPENPLLGLLYPEDGTGRGQGSLSYRVRPLAGLPTGTVVENRARIYFDFNDPIDTPVVRNTLDAAAPTSRVTTPTATITDDVLTLSWAGADDANGSGVASYDVFASVDGGAWFQIIYGSTATSATFGVVPGHTYGFYSVARDLVGHVEDAPQTPDAVITVLSDNAAPTASAGGPYTATYGGALALDASASSDPDADPLTYSWTINGHAAATTGVSPTLSWAQLTGLGIAGVGTFTLSVAVNDGQGHTTTSPAVTLTVNPAQLTVAADARTKVYGTDDPALTFRLTSGALVGSDVLTGALARLAGEDAGDYAIGRGTLTAGPNYDVTFVGSSLTVTQRGLTVAADAQSKVYGTADLALTYRVTEGTVLSGDALTGSLARESGENVGSYAIGRGTLTAGGNYTITYIGSSLSITPAAITVAADAQTKAYGTGDPALTFRLTSGALVSGDAFSGLLAREPGEDTGTYAIGPGSLTAGGNYDLTFVGDTFVITKADQTIDFADPSARDKTVGTVTLSASSDSGLPVTFSIVSGPATLSGDVLTTTGVGTIVVKATQVGDGNHNPAEVTRSFAVEAAVVSGVVFKDFNRDGFVDFGELGTAGVAVTLTGRDYNGTAVNLAATTGAGGYYQFGDLLPGSYSVTVPGTVTLVTVDGAVVGSGNTTAVALTEGTTRAVGVGLAPAAGDALRAGQTAGIGFWHNKNGQALIKSLNGSATSTQLGNWLAATFPNMFAPLAGKTNAQVTAYYLTLFTAKGDQLEAHVLATALSVYATNRGLSGGTYAAAYGFVVTADGAGVATVNVGSSGAAVGRPNGTTLTVMEILLAVDRKATRTTTTVGFVLYAADATGRRLALDLFDKLNDLGNIDSTLPGSE